MRQENGYSTPLLVFGIIIFEFFCLMADSIPHELTVVVFKLRFVNRTIWKQCLNLGQIDISAV